MAADRRATLSPAACLSGNRGKNQGCSKRNRPAVDRPRARQSPMCGAFRGPGRRPSQAGRPWRWRPRPHRRPRHRRVRRPRPRPRHRLQPSVPSWSRSRTEPAPRPQARRAGQWWWSNESWRHSCESVPPQRAGPEWGSFPQNSRHPNPTWKSRLATKRATQHRYSPPHKLNPSRSPEPNTVLVSFTSSGSLPGRGIARLNSQGSDTMLHRTQNLRIEHIEAINGWLKARPRQFTFR